MSDQPDPREEQPMYTDSKGNLYRSKHEIPASELMGAFYQDLLGISQGFADDLTAAQQRIAELEQALRAFLYHVLGDESICPWCLYDIDSQHHLSDCPIAIAKALLDKS